MVSIALFACGGETPISEIPLGIGYLMAYCSVHGVALRHVTSAKDLWDKDQHWDFVGLSSPAYGLSEAVLLAREVKNNTNAKTILGGQGALWDGVSGIPEFDYVVLGDGELSLYLILTDQTSLAPNSTATANFGRPRINMDRLRVHDLNMLPFPCRGKVGYSCPIVTSRGCPYNCAFCSSRAHWGEPRYHSVEYILDDIARQSILSPDMREVYIVDDLFMHPEKRFYELHERWMREGWNNRFSISGFTRTDLVNPEKLRMMKQMGFPYLRIGIESGSDRILKAIGKGVTVEDHQQAIEWAAQINLPVRGSFVRGVPGETEEDRKLTAAFVEKNNGKLEIMGDYTWKPFPGSRWYNGESPLEVDMRVR
jgi:radical SAM superfamily enzyme YgiQ (UPF0313 family)